MAELAISVPTTYDSAIAFLKACNDALSLAGVVDEEGNPAFLTPTESSPAWLFALGVGTLYVEWRSRLREVGLNQDPASCSDAQVLRLAQIAGIARDTGSPSYCYVTLLAESTAGCTIEEGYVFTTADGTRWLCSADTTLVAGASSSVLFVSELNGAVSVVQDQTFTPIAELTGLESALATSAGAVGEGYESIASLRRRIIAQDGSASPLEKCRRAIQDLTGIVSCKIYFNDSLTTTITLPGGQEVDPRYALVTIYGTDSEDLIGETFFKYLMSPTSGSYSSVYTTESGQEITVYYDKAVDATLQARVIVEAGTTTTGYEQYLKEAVIAASGTLGIGENYSSLYMSNYVENFSYAKVLGIQLWNGTAWDFTTNVNWNAVGRFTEASITISEV